MDQPCGEWREGGTEGGRGGGGGRGRREGREGRGESKVLAHPRV